MMTMELRTIPRSTDQLELERKDLALYDVLADEIGHMEQEKTDFEVFLSGCYYLEKDLKKAILGSYIQKIYTMKEQRDALEEKLEGGGYYLN